MGEQVLPFLPLLAVEVLLRKFPIGKQDVLLLLELRGAGPARHDGNRGVGDIFHTPAGEMVIFGSIEPVRPDCLFSPDGAGVIRPYILVRISLKRKL